MTEEQPTPPRRRRPASVNVVIANGGHSVEITARGKLSTVAAKALEVWAATAPAGRAPFGIVASGGGQMAATENVGTAYVSDPCSA